MSCVQRFVAIVYLFELKIACNAPMTLSLSVCEFLTGCRETAYGNRARSEQPPPPAYPHLPGRQQHFADPQPDNTARPDRLHPAAPRAPKSEKLILTVNTGHTLLQRLARN